MRGEEIDNNSSDGFSGYVKGIFEEKRWIYQYVDGYLVRRKSWFPKGSVFMDSHFKEGKADGLSTSWYENGQMRSETNSREGKLDGVSIDYFENGQIEDHIVWKNHKMNGLWTRWYENGQKMFNRNYNDGRILGLSKEWHENGQKKEEVFYEMTGETKEVVIPSIPFDRFGNKIEPSTKLVKVVKLIYKTIW